MSQNNIDYSQNPDGQELLDNYLSKSQENALTLHSGIQRPSYAKEGTMWLDTSGTPWMLKVYDGTDDIIVGSLDASTNRFIPSDPLTTTGDLIVEGEDGKPTRLAAGTAGYVLTSNGAGQLPSYEEKILVPVGSIFSYPADTPPKGFLVCDGSTVAREDYSELFALIGTTFGDGLAAYGWEIEGSSITKCWTKYEPTFLGADAYSDSDCTTRIGKVVFIINMYKFTPSGSESSYTAVRTGDLDIAGFKLPNFINRTFWGGTKSGQYLEAGLPNITGTLETVRNNVSFVGINQGSGALFALNSMPNVGGSKENLGEQGTGISFDASRSSEIYGRSDTVQPAALQTLIVIKY